MDQGCINPFPAFLSAEQSETAAHDLPPADDQWFRRSRGRASV